jgi:serine/threonine-protein kinase
MAQPALEPGRVLAGKYRLGERLGEGGMGAVYRAEHLVLQAPVAIKVIEREIVADEATKARFAREAQAAAALRSPHVVQILDYGTEGDLPFMVMELLEGETLAQRIKRKRRLSANETTWVLSHVGRAVAKAHELGIVHRDLKPDNVFLVKNEDAEVAKVLDFGVAKIEATALGGGDGSTHTRTGSLLGTPYYMSPEQAQGNKAIDARSDLWALAVIAFECLTGKRPFSSDGLGDLVLQICIREIPIPSHVAPVPLGFDGWFERATQREPDARFQTAKELTDALREALGVETREVPSTPDVHVTVSSGPWSSPPPEDDEPRERKVDAKATTLAEESLLRTNEYAISDVTRRLKREDVLPPAGEPAQHSSEAPRARRSNGRLIVGVGLAALALGALVGVIALSGRPGFRVGDLTAPAAKVAVRGSKDSVTQAQKPAVKLTESPSNAPSSKSSHPGKSAGAVSAPTTPPATLEPASSAVAPPAPSATVEPPVAAPETSAATPPAPAPEAPPEGAPPPAPHDSSAPAPQPQEGPSAPGPSPSLPEQLTPPSDDGAESSPAVHDAPHPSP